MKFLAALSLLLVLTLTVFAQDEDPALTNRLTNKDVVAMVKAELPAEVIVEKIKHSRCTFDTDPSMLAELKYKGVPDAVLRAMVLAPYGRPQIQPEPTPKPAPAERKTHTAEAAPAPPRATAISDALPTYGNAAELLNLRKVYVTSDEPTSRDLIFSVFRKYEGLQIVYSPEEADFFVECGVKASTESRGLQRSHYMRQQMTVFTLNGSGRKRVLWYENETIEERSGFTFSRPNEVNMAMHFVSMLKKMRSGERYKGQGRNAAPQ